MHEPWALVLWLGTSAGEPSVGVPTRVQTAYLRDSDTDLPPDATCPSLDEPGTGGLVLDEPEVQLVTTAAQVVKAVAHLPIDPRDEDIVEALVRRRAPVRASRPLQAARSARGTPDLPRALQ